MAGSYFGFACHEITADFVESEYRPQLLSTIMKCRNHCRS
jgi:hypothetical protein